MPLLLSMLHTLFKLLYFSFKRYFTMYLTQKMSNQAFPAWIQSTTSVVQPIDFFHCSHHCLCAGQQHITVSFNPQPCVSCSSIHTDNVLVWFNTIWSIHINCCCTNTSSTFSSWIEVIQSMNFDLVSKRIIIISMSVYFDSYTWIDAFC